jgi:hypothetical protein
VNAICPRKDGGHEFEVSYVWNVFNVDIHLNVHTAFHEERLHFVHVLRALSNRPPGFRGYLIFPRKPWFVLDDLMPLARVSSGSQRSNAVSV